MSVLAAETDERAQWLAGSGRLSFVRLRQGRPGRFPSPEEAAAHEFTPTDRLLLEQWTSSAVVGGPETVARQLDELIARTGVQELMVTTLCHDHADRVRSYEIVAELAGLTAVGAERGA